MKAQGSKPQLTATKASKSRTYGAFGLATTVRVEGLPLFIHILSLDTGGALLTEQLGFASVIGQQRHPYCAYPEPPSSTMLHSS